MITRSISSRCTCSHLRSFSTSTSILSSQSDSNSTALTKPPIRSWGLPSDSFLSTSTSTSESIVLDSPSSKKNNNNNNNLNLSSSSRTRSKVDVSKKEKGFFGFLRSKPSKDKLDEVSSKKQLEAQKVLERTLRNGKGLPAGIGGDFNFRRTTLNSKGDVLTSKKSEYEKGELCSRYGIQPRDLRKLDSAVPTVVPTILVRRAAILFTVLHLRVVITANEVSLFDSINSEDSFVKGIFIWHLEHALKQSPKAAHGLPYEFRALESCLISVTTVLETEWANIRDLVVELIDGLEDHIERDKLRLLLQYSRKLSTFQKRATLVQECLEEVLQNDDDLASMYLTAKLNGVPRDSSEHEEIELLLESFSKHVEEIVSEVDNLAANVRHTEDIVELILDANRNSLLGLDLKVSICTLGLTSGALVAGLFGMNLTTNLEEHPYAFPLITLSAFTFAAVVTAVGLRRLRRMRKVGLGGGNHGARENLDERLGGAWREQRRVGRRRD